MFSKGDRVECIDPDYGLRRGAIYTISMCNKKFVYLVDVPSSRGFYHSRFCLVEPQTHRWHERVIHFLSIQRGITLSRADYAELTEIIAAMKDQRP